MYQYAGLFYWPSCYWLLTRIIHAKKKFVAEASNSQNPRLHCCSNIFLNCLTVWSDSCFFYSLVSLWELKRNFFSFLDSSYSSVSLVLSFWKCFLDSKSFICFDQLINEGFSRGHLGYSVGGAVVSWLVRSTPDRGPGFEMGTLRCVHEQDTWLSQCLSPPRCGETLQWTSILSRGGVEILLDVSCYRNQDKLRPDGPLGSYADLFGLFQEDTQDNAVLSLSSQLQRRIFFHLAHLKTLSFYWLSKILYYRAQSLFLALGSLVWSGEFSFRNTASKNGSTYS